MRKGKKGQINKAEREKIKFDNDWMDMRYERMGGIREWFYSPS